MIAVSGSADFMNGLIYLDGLSTTPVDPRVLEVMLPYFTVHFGNANSSTHAYGWRTAEAVELAREQVASLIGAEREEIIFTSGATESCNLALRGAAAALASKGNHIITCSTEHKAVLDTCAALEKNGWDITRLPVDANGQIDLDLLLRHIRPTTILIAIMFANNETGVIHPVKEIGAVAKQHGIWFFCDATQAVGKIPVDVQSAGIDLMALSAHKLYGPKGCGALYLRRKQPRVKLLAQLTGGAQERALRGGTLNVPGIAGFGAAAQLCAEELQLPMHPLQPLRDHLEHAATANRWARVTAAGVTRLPHVSHMQFFVPNGTQLLTQLCKDIAVSGSSACNSGQPSHVLQAMGRSSEAIKASIRFGLTRFTTQAELDRTLTLLQQAMEATGHLTGETP